MKYMALIITIILFISIQNIYSQYKIAVGINAIPAITYSFSPADLPSPKNNFGYSFGINSIYVFQPDLFIETGLNYQNKRLLFAKNIIDTRKGWIDVNGNGIFDPGDRLDYSRLVPSDYSYKYSSLNLPIMINYRTSKINITSFVCSFGISLNYIFNIEEISNSAQFGQNSEGNKSSSDFTSSISLGIAIFQPIVDNIFIISGPKYDYDIYSSQKNINAKFHTLGFQLKLFIIL
jgi:hypothetical protein